jgi:hypothetical protein
MGANKGDFNGGSTARKDLRGTPRSALQMLFGGGKTAAEDLRGSGPRGGRPLFSGGKTSERDLRTGRDEGMEPDDDEMLSQGGEPGGDDGIPEELHIAGEDVMAAFKGGKPEDLTRALYSFFTLCESQPHDEAGASGEPLPEGNES